jgi:hypothetical protein
MSPVISSNARNPLLAGLTKSRFLTAFEMTLLGPFVMALRGPFTLLVNNTG